MTLHSAENVLVSLIWLERERPSARQYHAKLRKKVKHLMYQLIVLRSVGPAFQVISTDNVYESGAERIKINVTRS